MSYFSNISGGVKTTMKGMSLAIKYFFDARKKRKKEWVAEDNYFEKAEGTFTVQYPSETIPVPDNGRYQLHNEIDDCIVCDKCAKICPVDCIDIEPVRSPEVFGQTSDGTPLRIHAAKFDIDMAKCCFCGLCTVVCPTECLTMTKEYDFSTSDILDHNFSFSKMSELEIAEKKKEFEDFQAAKAKPKEELPEVGKKPAAKPMMKPKAKPAMKSGAKPIMKPMVPKKEEDGDEQEKSAAKPAVKPIMKPKVKPVLKPASKEKEAGDELAKPVNKPVVKPKVKPVIKPKVKPSEPKEPDNEKKESEVVAKKPVKPIMKPKIPKKK